MCVVQRRAGFTTQGTGGALRAVLSEMPGECTPESSHRGRETSPELCRERQPGTPQPQSSKFFIIRQHIYIHTSTVHAGQLLVFFSPFQGKVPESVTNNRLQDNILCSIFNSEGIWMVKYVLKGKITTWKIRTCTNSKEYQHYLYVVD